MYMYILNFYFFLLMINQITLLVSQILNAMGVVHFYLSYVLLGQNQYYVIVFYLDSNYQIKVILNIILVTGLHQDQVFQLILHSIYLSHNYEILFIVFYHQEFFFSLIDIKDHLNYFTGCLVPKFIFFENYSFSLSDRLVKFLIR